MKLSETGQKLLQEPRNDIRLMAVDGGIPLPPSERTFLICRYAVENKDNIRDHCIQKIRQLPEAFITGFLNDPELDDHVIYFLSYVFQDKREILRKLFLHPAAPAKVFEMFSKVSSEETIRVLLESETRWINDEAVVSNLLHNPALPKEFYEKVSFHLLKKVEAEIEQEVHAMTQAGDGHGHGHDAAHPVQQQHAHHHHELIQETGEMGEEGKRSMAGKIAKMSIAEKIKLAMMGNKEVRSVLIKESNKLISGAVMKNPRITEGEIVKITQDKNANEELIRSVTNNRNWMQNHNIKFNLSLHPKTPVPVILKLLPSLSVKELQTIAGSKNVTAVVATQARKVLATRNK